MLSFRKWSALLLTAGLLLSACAKSPAPSDPEAGKTEPGTQTPSVSNPVKLRMGVAAEILSYAPINIAMAKGYFKEEGIELERTVMSGDGPVNAALASGEIQFAAGSSTALIELVVKGVERQAVYGLMNKMSMDITASNAFLERTGVSPSDPLDKKVRAMKNATFGSLSLGGTPDINTRYLMRRAGMDPQNDIEIAAVGGVPAMLATVQQGGIDGFMLSQPTGFNVEATGSGKVFIVSSEVPEFREFHFTIVSVNNKYAKENPEVVRRVNAALAKASRFLVDEPEAAADLLKEWYPTYSKEIMVKSINSLSEGFATLGAFTEKGWSNVIEVTKPDAGLKAEDGNGRWWTNEYLSK